jgi:hypothetical protein
MATLQEYPSTTAWVGILAILVAGGLAMLLRHCGAGVGTTSPTPCSPL